MKNISILLIITSMIASCKNENNEKKVIIRKESHTAYIDPTKDVKPTSRLRLKIDGMTCMMGCGASIRKELYATKAVKIVDFDFQEGRKVNEAKIEFDKSKISDNEIMKIITTMNEKQFKISEPSVVEL